MTVLYIHETESQPSGPLRALCETLRAAAEATMPHALAISLGPLDIMGDDAVARSIETGAQHLVPEGHFAVYGPFNYGGEYTSESNARFDQWLAARDPASAIRDFEAVDELARSAGMALVSDAQMPANNRLLCWRKAIS